MRSYLLQPLVVAAAWSLASAQTYRIHNNCPSAIDVFVGGESQGSLDVDAWLVKDNLGTSPGFIYATTNNGIVDGKNVATRAGFYFEPGYWYYYIVRDQNATHFNTGMSVTPSFPEAGGYCKPAICESGNCDTAFTDPPTFNGGPPPSNYLPTPPYYQCKVDAALLSFEITFCPSGKWPVDNGTPVRIAFNPKKCMGVHGTAKENGAPVVIHDCDESDAQNWVFQPGTSQIRLANTDYCLDAGSSPANGVSMKLWECFKNLPAQTWHVNEDKTIALKGTGLCLDLPYSHTVNWQFLQTFSCGNQNPNQVWSHSV